MTSRAHIIGVSTQRLWITDLNSSARAMVPYCTLDRGIRRDDDFVRREKGDVRKMRSLSRSKIDDCVVLGRLDVVDVDRAVRS